MLGRSAAGSLAAALDAAAGLQSTPRVSQQGTQAAAEPLQCCDQLRGIILPLP
jgi:hypothetical protein